MNLRLKAAFIPVAIASTVALSACGTGPFPTTVHVSEEDAICQKAKGGYVVGEGAYEVIDLKTSDKRVIAEIDFTRYDFDKNKGLYNTNLLHGTVNSKGNANIYYANVDLKKKECQLVGRPHSYTYTLKP